MLMEGAAPGPHDQNQAVEPTEPADQPEHGEQQLLFDELKTRLSEFRRYFDNPNLLNPNQPMPAELAGYQVEFTVPEGDRFPGSYTLNRSYKPELYLSRGTIEVPKELLGRSADSIKGNIHLQFTDTGAFDQVYYTVAGKDREGKDFERPEWVSPGTEEGKRISQDDLRALKDRFDHLVQRGIKPEEVSRIELKDRAEKKGWFFSFPTGNEFGYDIGAQGYRVHLEDTDRKSAGQVMKYLGDKKWEKVGKFELSQPESAPAQEPARSTEVETKEQLARVQELYNQVRPYWDHPERLMPGEALPHGFTGYEFEVTSPGDSVPYRLRRDSSGSWLSIPKSQITSDKNIDGIFVRFGEQGQQSGVGCLRTDRADANDRSKKHLEFHTIMDRERTEDDALTPNDIATSLGRASELIEGGELLAREGHVLRSITLNQPDMEIKISPYGMVVIDRDDPSKDEYQISFKDGSAYAYSSKHPRQPLGKINLAGELEQTKATTAQESFSTLNIDKPLSGLSARDMNIIEERLNEKLEAARGDMAVGGTGAIESDLALLNRLRQTMGEQAPEQTPERLTDEKLTQLKEALPLLLELALRRGWDENYKNLIMDKRLTDFLDIEPGQKIFMEGNDGERLYNMTQPNNMVSSGSFPSGWVSGRLGEVHFDFNPDGLQMADDFDKLRTAPREPLVGSREDFVKVFEEIKQRVGDELEERIRARQRRIEELRQKLGNPERTGGTSG